MSDNAWMLAGAAAVGFAAGFLLVKAELDQAPKIRKLLQLRDKRLMLTVLWAVIAGTAVSYIIFRLGVASPDLPARSFWPSLTGGLIAGTGIVMAGICPVTAASALGRGRIAALFAFAGMAAACPVAGMLKKILPDSFENAGGTIATPQPAEVFWQMENPLLWVLGTALILIVTVKLSFGKSE